MAQTENQVTCSGAVSGKSCDGPTREDLLKALDAELAGIAAAQSSTGRSRWALLLTLATLIGAAIQCWDAKGFHTSQVIQLTLASVLLLDFFFKAVAEIDKPLTVRSRKIGGFFDASQLIGAGRIALLLEISQQVFIFTAALLLKRPELRLLAVCSFLRFCLGLGGVGLSFIRLTKLIPRDIQEAHWWTTALMFSAIWGFRICAVVSAMLPIWKNPAVATSANVRLALVLAAISYVLTLLIYDQFPVKRSAALRDIRQNLAFMRISLDEARTQAELLLVGAELAQALQRPFDELANSTNQVRAALDRMKKLLCERNDLATSASTFEFNFIALKNCDSKIRSAWESVQTEHKQLKENVLSLRLYHRLLDLLAPRSAEETKPLFTEIEAALKPIDNDMSAQGSRVKAILGNPISQNQIT